MIIPGIALAAALPPIQAPHHLAGALEVLEQPVDVAGGDPGPVRDPQAARPGDDTGIPPLLRRHAEDHRLGAPELALVDRTGHLLDGVLAPGHAGEHLQQILDRAELAHLLELGQEVLQRELVLQHPLRRGPRLLGIHRVLGLVDQRQHVAHAQDPTGHPVRVERLEVLETFSPVPTK